jgi:molecular chaperone DnaK (HSP70)
MVTNLKNTVWGFKRLVGSPFSDPFVQEEVKRMPFQVVEQPGDRVGIKVQVKWTARQADRQLPCYT